MKLMQALVTRTRMHILLQIYSLRFSFSVTCWRSQGRFAVAASYYRAYRVSSSAVLTELLDSFIPTWSGLISARQPGPNVNIRPPRLIYRPEMNTQGVFSGVTDCKRSLTRKPAIKWPLDGLCALLPLSWPKIKVTTLRMSLPMALDHGIGDFQYDQRIWHFCFIATLNLPHNKDFVRQMSVLQLSNVIKYDIYVTA